jgi:hypothetical protein
VHTEQRGHSGFGALAILVGMCLVGIVGHDA